MNTNSVYWEVSEGDLWNTSLIFSPYKPPSSCYVVSSVSKLALEIYIKQAKSSIIANWA